MSVFQDFIKPTLVLAVICLVISFALAKTYSITQPIIDRLAIETANAARAEVLPGASDFEQLTVANMPEGGLDAYRATDGSGYVITTAWKGYGGTIKVMFGMDANGVITGAKVLENSETAGLGTKACDPKHMVQYTGKTVDTLGEVNAVGGATVSSTAIMNAAKAAYRVYNEVGGEGAAAPQRAPAKEETLRAIYPDAQEFIPLDMEVEAYRVEGKEHIVVISEPSFHDDIVAAVGFAEDGTITGVALDYINENPDYGMKVARPEYLEQFIGKTSADEVASISGATSSSDVLKKAINKAVAAHPAAQQAPELQKGAE